MRRMKKTITKLKPEKNLIKILPKKSGRTNSGKITVRHQGGRQKRFLRSIDWRRDKLDVPARVASIEYDPNRTANVALLVFKDGEKRYILAPAGVTVGSTVVSGSTAEIKVGNALPLSKIPIGLPIHNIELTPGRGAQIVRSAGGAASIIAKEKGYAQVKLPSGEIRLVNLKSYATIGQVGSVSWKETIIGKAGRARRMGKRPTVRGVAMNPASHPHGGGEGRSGEGRPPKTPWGKADRGRKTRKKKKTSDKYIVRKRK